MATWSLPAKEGEGQWAVRVIPNLFPVLSIAGSGRMAGTKGGSLRWQARGYHEILVESPHHHDSWGKHPDKQGELILQTLVARLSWLGQQRGICTVQIFKNHGARAGASLPHPHFQLVALPLIPPVWEDKLKRARRYRQLHGECLYCAVGRTELKTGERLVEATEHFLVICPAASRFPLQMHVQPRHHQADFKDIDQQLGRDLAGVLGRSLKRLEKVMGEHLAYNLILHTTPSQGEHPYFHWHWAILPRQATPAGFEWGTGMFVNSIPPETACRMLLR